MRYEEYKPTGLFWLSEIPSNWEWHFLSQVATEQKIKKPIGEIFPVLTLSYGEVKKKKNVDEGLVPETYDNYQMLIAGNIVMRLIDLQNDHTSLRTGLVKETGIITSAYTCLMPKENSVYLRYLLHSYDTKKVFYGFGGGVRQSIGFKDIKHLNTPVPPREEQDQIARYLDWQVSKINKLIAAKKKQIISLTAKKKIMVSDIITHGLNPKAEMKFSGVKWLGNIPAHWTVVKLRGILSAVSEKGHPEMQLLSVVREQGVIVRNIEDSESNHNFIPYDLSGYKVVRKNQFAINKMKAWQGSYGISQFDGIVSPAYFVFNVNFKNLEYFHYAIRSKIYVNFFAQASDGIRVGQWDLSMNKMKDIPFILPPENEQTEIVHYIPAQIKIIEEAISTIQSQIDKLHELRTRLISDVVTGQMDVRGIEVPDFTLVEETDEFVDEDENPEASEEQED